MKAILRVLRLLFVATGWLLFATAVGLMVLEESGWLTSILRQRIAAELGPLGPHFDIERVRLSWFEPGVELEGITFAGERTEDGSWIAGKESLRISSAHVLLHPRLDRAAPVERVTVSGGRVVLSGTLVEALETLLAEREGPERPGPARPPISVTGLEVDLEMPGQEELPLGSADLLVEEDEDAEIRMSGRLWPTLGGAVTSPSAVHIEGRSWRESGLQISATARALPLDSTEMKPVDALRHLEGFRGELTVETAARLHPDAAVAPQARVRLQLRDADLAVAEVPPLAEAELDVDGRFAPEPGMDLWDPRAWSATVRAQGRWNRSPVEVWAFLGERATPGNAVEGFARAGEVRLDEESLRAFGMDDEEDPIWKAYRALAPKGVADASVGFRLPEPAPGEVVADQPVRLVVDLAYTGDAEMTFYGWEDEITGEARGVPIPCDRVEGLIVFAYDEEQPRSKHLAFVGMQADHGSGLVRGDGLFSDPLVIDPALGPKPRPDIDFRIEVEPMAVDERLRDGLEGWEATAGIWDAYRPTGGRIGAGWRLRQRAALGGLTAHARIDLIDVDAEWSEVPVPMQGLDGEMELRWARHSARIRGTDPPELKRPFGIRWTVKNGPDVVGATAKIDGLFRWPSLAGRVIERGDLPEKGLQQLVIDMDELLLRGDDWDVLAQRFPEMGKQVEELNAAGRMRVRFRGSRPDEAASYRYDIEGSPVEAYVTPLFFPSQVKDLAGRVLITGIEVSEEEEPLVESRFSFVGRWPGDVELASSGTVPADGLAHASVLGAGVDPTNPLLKGVLVSAIDVARGQEGHAGELDISAVTVEGLLDFEGLISFDPTVEERGLTTYRVFLRGNRLQSEDLRLDDLLGVLTLRDDVLQSPHLYATLAGTPVELENVLFLSIEDAKTLEAADPLLREASFMTEGEGFALQADWSASRIPLDRAHLEPFLDPETLDVLFDKTGLSGELDVPEGRFIVVTDRNSKGKVAFRGTLRPRNVSLVAGLPIVVVSAEVAVESLVQEAGRVRGWWEVEELAAEVAGRRLSGAAMIMTFVDGRLTIDNLRGDFEGGRVTALGGLERADNAIAVDLGEPFGFSVAMRADDVNVDRLLGGLFESSVDDLGRLDGWLRLTGAGTDVLALSGSGVVRLSEARLWSIPVMRELFGSLGSDNKAVFDSMQSRFFLDDAVIHMQEMQVRSPLLRLVGDGTLDLDGTLSCDFEVRYSLVDKLGPFNRVLYWLNNSLWQVMIRGDMARPEVVVRNSIREFLFGFDDEFPRHLPLPGWTPLSRRF